MFLRLVLDGAPILGIAAVLPGRVDEGAGEPCVVVHLVLHAPYVAVGGAAVPVAREPRPDTAPKIANRFREPRLPAFVAAPDVCAPVVGCRRRGVTREREGAVLVAGIRRKRCAPGGVFPAHHAEDRKGL